MRNHISIIRISNGYMVSIPINPQKADMELSALIASGKKESGDEGKSYIPTNKNLSFFKSLDEVLDFLKSIEKNISMDDFGFGIPSAVLGA